MKERLLEVLHYRRNKQIFEKKHEEPIVLIDREKIPQDQEIYLFPHAFNAGEIIRRQSKK